MRQYNLSIYFGKDDLTEDYDKLRFRNVEYSDFDRILELSLREGYTVTVTSPKKDEDE